MTHGLWPVTSDGLTGPECELAAQHSEVVDHARADHDRAFVVLGGAAAALGLCLSAAQCYGP